MKYIIFQMFQTLTVTPLKLYQVCSQFFKGLGIKVIMAIAYREARVGIIS